VKKRFYKFHFTRVMEYTGCLPTIDTAEARMMFQRDDGNVIGDAKCTTTHLAFDSVVDLFDIKMTKAMYRYLDKERAAAERQGHPEGAATTSRARRKARVARGEPWHAFHVVVIAEYVAWAEAADEAAARVIVTDESARGVVHVRKHRDVLSLKLLGEPDEPGPTRRGGKTRGMTTQTTDATERRPPAGGKVRGAGARGKRAEQEGPTGESPNPPHTRPLDEHIDEHLTMVDDLIEMLTQQPSVNPTSRKTLHRLAVRTAKGLEQRIDGLRKRVFSPYGNLLNQDAVLERLQQTRKRLEVLEGLEP
jgi:hypothetical protein